MTAAEIVPIVSSAFAKLFDEDKILFGLGCDGISEETLTFRLALYLQELLPQHNVDCEYNRFEDTLKNDPHVDQKWMMPDVIVHRRTKKEHNLIVVEAKKWRPWRRGLPRIVRKLEAFTRVPGKYQYRLGLAWRMKASTTALDHQAIWYMRGTELCRTSLSGFQGVLLTAINNSLLEVQNG